jgi:DNA polymerase III subunit epsilon
MNNNRFIAMDFETANYNRNSACSIGIAVIEDLEIIETKHWFIRPPELYFHPFNISIHGIAEK